MNIQTNNITALTSQYGVSDSLKAMFEGLRETPGLYGDKFRRQDVNKFAQYIVCRNYGKLCLELSYLLYSITNYKPSNQLQTTELNKCKNQTNKLLAFFWLNENFSPSRFRQYFDVPYQQDGLNISLSKINLNICLKKNTFSVSPTRAGVLAVLFEFIMMIKPALIEQINTLFNNNNKGEHEIKALSSSLQKLLYEFLAEHLTNAQTQRRFRFITQWLNKQGYSEQFLTDQNILSFWQMASTSETSLSFKLYSSVLTDLIGVDQAIKQTKQMFEVEQSLALGDSEQSGELSADVLYQQVFEQCEVEHNYDFLVDNPKFLTKAQWHITKPLIDYQNYQQKLGLSFARQAVFGQWQSSIVQSKRQSAEKLQIKLHTLPDYDYVNFKNELTHTNNSVQDVLMALTYIFLKVKVSEGISGLLLRLSAKELTDVKDQLQQAILSMNTKGISDSSEEQRLFNAFENVMAKSKVMQLVEQDLKKAFQKNNKLGFKELPHKTELNIYRDGESALQHCAKALLKQKQLFTQIWQDNTVCLKDFRSDASIFKQSFENIYGIGVNNDS